MTLAFLFASFAADVLLAVAVFALFGEVRKRSDYDLSFSRSLGYLRDRLSAQDEDRAEQAKCHDRTLSFHGEQLSDLRGRVGVAETRLRGHDGFLEHLDRVACKAHGQTVLTDARLDEFEVWADVARTDVLARVEEAASGLATAANVLRLIPAPDVTTPAPAPLDERHHDDDGPNQ